MKFYGLYILWRDPLIVSCFAGRKEEQAAFSIIEPADILFHPTWLWTLRSCPYLLYLAGRGRLRNKRCHFIASSPEESGLLRSLHLPQTYSSIIGFVNERNFVVDLEREKEFDAIYAASMMPYKRIELAREVRSLFVQTYGSVKNDAGDFDLHRFCPSVAHAQFNRMFLPDSAVIQNFQRARVGLALSAEEGAMLAMIEYMLVGLPVVTTPARGGREALFNPEFVEVVDPEPSKIAAAVQRLIRRNINPHDIRAYAIEQLRLHRQRYCHYISRVLAARGGTVPTLEDLYQHLYSDSEGIRAHYCHRHALSERGLPNTNA